MISQLSPHGADFCQKVKPNDPRKKNHQPFAVFSVPIAVIDRPPFGVGFANDQRDVIASVKKIVMPDVAWIVTEIPRGVFLDLDFHALELHPTLQNRRR